MMRQFFKQQHPEQGAVFLIVLLFLPALLVCASWAIDLGNYYRARMQLQKAADLATMAGIGYAIRATAPSRSRSALRREIQRRANEVVRENLSVAGLSGIADTRFTPATGELSVAIEAELKPLLGFMTPVALYHVSAQAASRIDVANVHLVLDFSASMLCPRSGPCDCLTPARVTDCRSLGVPLKIDDLREAVSTFLDRFSRARDRIGLTLFNMAGEVVVNIRDIDSNGFVKDDFDVINSIYDPISNTNISDGLLRSYSDFNAARLLGNDDLAVVFFSDGAPTGMRFLAAHPSNLQTNNPHGLGAYDYTHYTVQWSSTQQGPSSIVKTDAIGLDYNDSRPPRGAPGQFVPSCSSYHNGPPSNPALYNSVFDECLSNFGFQLPGMGSFGSGCGASGGNYSLCWRQQYYHAAVAASDLLRHNNGTVYSIGLGNPASLAEAIAASDPYQGIDDSHSLKTILLSRMANDYLEGVRVSQDIYGATHPEFNYENYRSYSSMLSLGTGRQGRFLGTPDSSQLKQLFDQIATRILLKLIR